jgi:hypothetical protein
MTRRDFDMLRRNIKMGRNEGRRRDANVGARAGVFSQTHGVSTFAVPTA